MFIKQCSILVSRGRNPLHFLKLLFCYSSLPPKVILISYPRKNHVSKRQNNEQSIVFWNSQITKLGRIGNIKEAEQIFNRISDKNTITWTALLTALAENAELAKARNVFDKMPEKNIASWNAMITAYVRNGLMINEAYELFSRMPDRNAVSYAAMITGFARAAMFEEAEGLYNGMPSNWRDAVCGNALICGYLKASELNEAVRIFCGMVEKDVVSWSSMVDGYCKKGFIDEAKKLFEIMPVKNVVSWTAMISGYLRTENFNDGFLLFLSMRQEGVVRANPTTLTIIVEACVNNDRLREGYQIHGLVSRMGIEHDVILSNSIINLYGKFGLVDDARRLFQFMSKKDVVSWNSLIASYIQADKLEAAYSIFQCMPERDIVSWTTIIGGYSGRGDVAKSINLFNLMPWKDDVAWTAVISGLVNNENFTEAIHWYIWMTRRSFRPNVLTLSSVGSAAAGLANLIIGLQLHGQVVKMQMESDLSVLNSFISMYSKCGNIYDAYNIFQNIESPNVVSFNSIITGYAYHGLGLEALKLFEKMQIVGQQPNKVTFLGVLSACAHMGLVKEGQNYFKSMRSAYCIEPGPDHYACMIDLLGRAGLLDQAVGVIYSMPYEPDAGVWGALLGASYSHLRPDIAKLSAEHLMRLEPDSATPLVVLSNLYSTLGMRDGEEFKFTQTLKRVIKSPGCSWVLV